MDNLTLFKLQYQAARSGELLPLELAPVNGNIDLVYRHRPDRNWRPVGILPPDTGIYEACRILTSFNHYWLDYFDGSRFRGSMGRDANYWRPRKLR